MYTIILFVIVAVLAYFAIKTSRYGKLSTSEIPIFAILSIGLGGYLIFLMVRVF